MRNTILTFLSVTKCSFVEIDIPESVIEHWETCRSPDSEEEISDIGDQVDGGMACARNFHFHSKDLACKHCWNDKKHLDNVNNGAWIAITHAKDPSSPPVPRIEGDMPNTLIPRYNLRPSKRPSRPLQQTKLSGHGRKIRSDVLYQKKRRCEPLKMQLPIDQIYHYLQTLKIPVPLK